MLEVHVTGYTAQKHLRLQLSLISKKPLAPHWTHL